MTEQKKTQSNQQTVYVQFMVACLLLVMFYTISQAMAMHQKVLDNLCERVQEVQGSEQTVESAETQIIDLQNRVEQNEQDIHDALGLLSELQDDYTGCPIEEDGDGWDFESYDDNTEAIGDMLSDLWQVVKASNGELMD